jgi:hypothetical protein
MRTPQKNEDIICAAAEGRNHSSIISKSGSSEEKLLNASETFVGISLYMFHKVMKCACSAVAVDHEDVDKFCDSAFG